MKSYDECIPAKEIENERVAGDKISKNCGELKFILKSKMLMLKFYRILNVNILINISVKGLVKSRLK